MMMIVDICYDSLVPFKEVQEMIFRSLKGSHALYTVNDAICMSLCSFPKNDIE
jgi:hypothetical protein